MLVATGDPEPASQQTEVIDLWSEDAVCTPPSGISTWPMLTAYAAGGFLGGDTLVICGGQDDQGNERTTCDLVNVKDGSLTSINFYHARLWPHILPIDEDTLWLTGGYDPLVANTELATTLFVTKVVMFVL